METITHKLVSAAREVACRLRGGHLPGKRFLYLAGTPSWWLCARCGAKYREPRKLLPSMSRTG